jgi:hypothetical protein
VLHRAFGRACPRTGATLVSLIDDLRRRREVTYTALKGIADAASAENRRLTPEEQDRWNGLMEALNAQDARIGQYRDQEQRGHDADAAFATIAGGAPRGRWQPTPKDEEFARAFASALKAKNPAPIDVYTDHPRSYFQPGVEQRTLLKTTATKAMPVSVYDRILMHLVENSAVMAAGATVITTQTGEDLQVPKDTAFVSSALTAATLRAWAFGTTTASTPGPSVTRTPTRAGARGAD